MRRWLLSWLRIREQPTPPPGFGPQDATFRASRRQLHYSVFLWGLKQLSALIGLFFSLALVGIIDVPYISLNHWLPEEFSSWDPGTIGVGFLEVPILGVAQFFELLAIATFTVQFLIGRLLLKLSWELRWYMIGDESIRIREGLWSINEQTMTISNIQNLIVRQGPIQKLLGIGDLEIHTAGGGAAKPGNHDNKKKNFHVGVLRGLEDPWRWRDHLRTRLSSYRGAGLGDADDHQHPTPSARPAALVPADLQYAASELRDAARALRQQWTPDASPPPLNEPD